LQEAIAKDDLGFFQVRLWNKLLEDPIAQGRDAEVQRVGLHFFGKVSREQALGAPERKKGRNGLESRGLG
jgi:hypothetical protein